MAKAKADINGNPITITVGEKSKSFDDLREAMDYFARKSCYGDDYCNGVRYYKDHGTGLNMVEYVWNDQTVRVTREQFKTDGGPVEPTP